MTTTLSLFNPPPDPPAHLVEFLSGFFAQWALNGKPTKAQKQRFAAIARQALADAAAIKEEQ